MTFSTYDPASRAKTHLFDLPPHRVSVAATILEILLAASKARKERRAVRDLSRMDAHLLRDLGLDSAAIDLMAEAARPPTMPRAA